MQEVMFYFTNFSAVDCQMEVRLAEWYTVWLCAVPLFQTSRQGFAALHSAVSGTAEALCYVSVTHQNIEYTQFLSYSLVLPE
jgi:hypothetical protein